MDKNPMRARREALKMTQAQVADALGVDRTLYSKWERGDRATPRDWRPKVAEVLGLDVRLLEPSARPRRLPSLLDYTRHRSRRPYLIRGTLDDVLNLGRVACRIADDARSAIGEGELRILIDTFPRDTRYELLLVLTVVAFGGRLVWTSPLRFDCPLLVLDDFRSEYGGDRMQWAILWELEGELIVIFGQVRTKSIFQANQSRVDFLVYHKTRGRRGQWSTVELDGSHHATQPSQDKERAENLLVPEIRYDNKKLLTDHWFHRFLEDVRAASERGAKREKERNDRAETYRKEREEQLRLREEQL